MAVKLGAMPEHGFDEPLGLLSDCHRRIENFLGVLAKIAEQNDDGPLRDEHRRAAEIALTYFRVAAPRHNEDEEESLFPLLRNCPHSRLHEALDAIKSLEADHRSATSAHQEIESLYRQWIDSGSLAEARRQRLAQLLRELTRLYQRHIEIEDRNIFPLAAAVLSREQLARVGKEMADRRGVEMARRPGSSQP